MPIINHTWIRFPYYELYPDEPDYADVGEEFAVYADDIAYGIHTHISDPMYDNDTDYSYRYRVYRSSYKVLDQEWLFRIDTGLPLRSLKFRNYSTSGVPGPWITAWAQSSWTGGLIALSFDVITLGVDFTGPGLYEDAIPGTTQAEYEFRVNGNLTAGGLGVPAGVLGIGGFDIRMLAIKNYEAIEPITCLCDPTNNTINFKADIYALPSSTSLFPTGWAPVSDVSYSIRADDFAAIVEEETVPLIATSGKIAEIDLASNPWDGKDDDGLPIMGLHDIRINAWAVNPDDVESVSSAPTKHCDIYIYKKQCTECVEGLSYNPFDFLRTPASLGYGWSSEGSMRVTESGGGSKLFLRLQDGNFLRWTKVGSSYVPFDRGTYIEVTKDSSYFQFKFKDQSLHKFNVSDGRLHTITDRNGNSLLYSYNGSGHLTSVIDGNGRSRTYVVTRGDGQPSSLTINGDGAHTTAYAYYGSSDPVSPNRLKSVTDPEGNVTTFFYYTNGPLSGIAYPDGTSVSLEYDEFGRKVQEVLSDRIFRSYQYLDDLDTEEGEVTVNIIDSSLTEAEYRQRYVTTDHLGRVVYESELVFDPGIGGNPLDRVYRSTSYGYNPLTSTSDPYLLTEVVDDNLIPVSMTYTSDGNLKTMTDKAGKVTTYFYTEEIDTLPINLKHRNLVRQILRPTVTVDGDPVTYDPTVFEYDSDGNLERVIDAKGEDMEMTRDDDGLILTVTDRNGHTTEFVYDGDPFNNESRNLLQIKRPKGESSLDGFRTVTFEYDDFDNVISVKDDLDNEIVTSYDNVDRPLTVTDALGRVTEYTYEDNLLQELLLSANNGSGGLSRKTSMFYDDAARLAEIRRDVDSMGTQQMRVKYAHTGYSQLAELTRIKNGAEKSFTFLYDEAGRLTEAGDSLPAPGITTAAYEPFCVGNATTSARGIRRKTSFDSRCLMTQVEVGDVDSGDALEVLNARETRGWEYDELGRMVKSTQSRSSSTYHQAVAGFDVYGSGPEERFYEYDELDRLVKMTFQDGLEMEWEYNPEGNVTRVTDSEGKVTEYTYFRDNLLKEVIIERSGDPDRVFTYSYDLAGRLLAIEYPTDTEIVAKFDDGTSTPGSGWDAKGQLLNLRYEKNGDLIRRLEFSYDESGNRASQLDVTDGTVLPAKAIKWEYVYDWLDRLEIVRRAEAVDVASLPGTIPTVSIYSYDASDNRVEFRVEQDDLTYRYEVDDADSVKKIYLTDGSDPEILIESLEPDEDGNLLTRTNELTNEVITYQWDDFDKLIRVSSAIGGTKTNTVKESNRYDINGIRKRKLDANGNSSSEYTAGISTALSKAATSSSSAPTISYLVGHQILGAEVNGVFQYFLGDSLGTVRDIVGYNSGTSEWEVIQSYEFNEHGIPMPGSAAGTGTFSPKTYQGGLSVNDDRNDSGLYLMGHRHYAADLGRFISRDPIGFAGGLNLFSGHSTNPVTFVDPSGLDPSEWLTPSNAWESGLTPYEASILRDGLLNATKWAPKGDCPSLMSTQIFNDSSNPGNAAYTKMDDGLVRYNQYNLDRHDWTKAWKVAHATATWANELCHVRGTSGDAASDKFQNKVLRNWIKGLDARMNELGFTPNAPGKNPDEGWYLFELKRAATNILDPAYDGWPATGREMEIQLKVWNSKQP